MSHQISPTVPRPGALSEDVCSVFGGSLTSLIAVEDLGKLFPPVKLWYLFSRADSLSFSWNMKKKVSLVVLGRSC